MLYEELRGRMRLCCETVRMGKDYTLCVYGGERAHAGSVTMAIARPSLTGEGISVTSSVLNAVGHKDEAVGRLFAEAVAKEKNCTAVCSCGIHIDDITPQQLEEIQQASSRLLKRVLESLSD